MKVLSLFDGISCGRIALERAGLEVSEYYASEIKKIAIDVAQLHYPDTIQVGDVTTLHYWNGYLYNKHKSWHIGTVDLLIGGSPCQDFSALNNGMGLNGDKSKLFYEYLRLLREINPKYFLLENVKMKKSSKAELDNYLGVCGIEINSALVSYQNRPRIYWTNIPGVTAPDDKGIDFQDYKDTDFEYCSQFAVKRTKSREKMWNDGKGKNNIKSCANITHANKILTIMRKQDRAPNSGLIAHNGFCRYLTRREIEGGQTLPLGYTDGLSYAQMQDVCGDGWTVDVIAHILSFLPKENVRE